MSDPVWLPTLNMLLPLNALPPQLGDLKSGLESLLGRIHYKDLMVSGVTDTARIRLTLVSYRRLALEFPGTGGLALVALPAATEFSTSELTVDFFYSWPLLNYFDRLVSIGMPETPEEWYEALFYILDLNPRDFFISLVEYFYGQANNPLDQFILDCGISGLNVSSNSQVDVIKDLLIQFKNLNVDIKEWAYQKLLSLAQNDEELLAGICNLFYEWTGIASVEDLLKIIHPEFMLTIPEIDFAIEFPRSWLKPVGATDPSARSRIVFDAGGLEFSSRTGLSPLNPATVQLAASEILNSGFVIEVEEMSLDLSPYTNLQAVNEAQFNPAFIGVAITKAAIKFPPAWFCDETHSNVTLYLENCVIGTGGVSGKIGLKALDPTTAVTDYDLQLKLGGESGIVFGLAELDVTLNQNGFESSHFKGFLNLPGLTDVSGAPSSFEFTGVIESNGSWSLESRGDLYLGDGIHIKSRNNEPVLKVSVSKAGSDQYQFILGGEIKLPSNSGFESVYLNGAVTVAKQASGQFQLISVQAESEVKTNWLLPGGIQVKSFQAGLLLNSQRKLELKLSGGLMLEESQAAINWMAVLSFPDFTNPLKTQLQVQLTLEKILLYNTFALRQGELQLQVSTLGSAPSGFVKITGHAGLFPEGVLTGNWDDDQFKLSLSDLEAKLEYSAAGFIWKLTQANIILPEMFSDGLSASPQRARVSIDPVNPLVFSYMNRIFSFNAHFEFSNITLSIDSGTATTQPLFQAKLETATLHLAHDQVPRFTDVNGYIRMQLQESQGPLQIGFHQIQWQINGLPEGMITLEEDLVLELGGGFQWVVKGADTGNLVTGMILSREQGNWSWEVQALMELHLPVSLMTDVNGDQLILSAGGSLKQANLSQWPVLNLNQLSITGTFHLGGADGFVIEQGGLEARPIENMLNPTAAHPFEIILTGELVLPDGGPRGGLQNAHFIFTGNNLPDFDLDGIIVGSGTLDIAGGYLPLNLKRLELEFDPALHLPEKLYPQHVTMIADAEVSIGDMVSSAVQDLRIKFDHQGYPQISLDGFYIEVSGLEMGSFILGGGLYLGGLNDIPSSLVLAGKLEGKMNGTGIMALAAFGVEEGLFLPLGAALAVDLGAAGIPLWTTGFLLTGVSGGISFTGSNNDPDDLRSYIQIDDDKKVTSQPRPVEGDTEVVADNQVDTGAAASVPSGEILAFSCPPGPCPPPSVGILYQPHPDTQNYPHRIIFKFTSLGKKQVDAILELIGIQPQSLNALTADSLSLQFSEGAASWMGQTFPFLSDQLVEIKNLLRITLKTALDAALGQGNSLYDALLIEAYKGLKAPNVNMKLTGTFSYTGVSSFLSVTGGVVISPTVQSAGVVGSVNLVGIPVGTLRGFLTLNNAQGLPDPALCGDINLALGPLEIGNVRMRFKYGFDPVGFGADLIELVQNFQIPQLGKGIQHVSPEKYRAHQQNIPATLQQFTPEECIGLAGYLSQCDFSGELKSFLLALFDRTWVNYNPHLSICGGVQPKIFGLPLGEELVGVSAEATKTDFALSFRFAPSYLFSYLFYNIVPPFDRMELAFALSLPDPRPLIEAGFGKAVTPASMQPFLEEAITHVLDKGLGTIRYSIAPMGLNLLDCQGRLIMPDLLNHPLKPGRNWKRPEALNKPSRMEVLLAAVKDGVLGNVFWKGSASELSALTQLRNAHLIGNFNLREDYFPHGGILGAGQLSMPKILIEPPPYQQIQQLISGNLLDRFAAGAELLNSLFTPVEIGQMAFYIPAPNPPLSDLASGLSPYQLIQNMQAKIFDPENVFDNEIYPLGECFLRGALGRDGQAFTLLGIPVAKGSIELIPPQNDTEGSLEIMASLPNGSWFQQFVSSADLKFKIRQRPQKDFIRYFGELSARYANLSHAQAVQELMTGLQEGLPKVALEIQLNNLSLPPSLAVFLQFKPNIQAGLFAYSPYYNYQEGLQPSDPLARIQAYGGLLMKVSGGIEIGKQFGLNIQGATAQLLIETQALGFPRIQFEFNAQSVQLPFGLPSIQQSEIKLDIRTAVLNSQSFFQIRGVVENQQVILSHALIQGKSKLQTQFDLSWPLIFNTGPIIKPGLNGNIRICDGISINIRLKARALVILTSGALPQVKLTNVQFKWNQKVFYVPDLDLAQSISDSQALVQWLITQLKNGAFNIFKELWSTPEAWLKSLKSGLIQWQGLAAKDMAKLAQSFGYDLLQTANFIIKNFSKLEDVVFALKSIFNPNVISMLNTLKAINFTNPQQLAKAIHDHYGSSVAVELGGWLWQQFKISWQQSYRQLALVLKAAGYNLNQVGLAVKSVANDLEKVLDALNQAFSQQVAAILQVLWDIGFKQANAYALACFHVFGNLNANLLMTFYKNNGVSGVPTIVNYFHAAGYSLQSVMSGIINVFGSTQTILNQLVAAIRTHYGTSQSILNQQLNQLKNLVGSSFSLLKNYITAIKNAYGSGSDAVLLMVNAYKNNFDSGLNALKNLVSAMKEKWGSNLTNQKNICSALKSVYGSSETQIVDIMNALKNAYGSTQSAMDQSLQALKAAYGDELVYLKRISAGFYSAYGSNLSTLKKVCNAFKTAYGSTSNLLKNITAALNYAYGSSKQNDIINAMYHTWSGVQDGLNKLIDAFIHVFGSSASALGKIALGLYNAGVSLVTILAKMVPKGLAPNWKP